MRPTPIKRGMSGLEALVETPAPLEGTVQVLPDPAPEVPVEATPLPSVEATPLPSGEAKKRAAQKRGSRSGSRVKPYKDKHGNLKTKLGFSTDFVFDQLWLLLPGLLPRGTSRSAWVVRVLEREIRALAKQKGIELPPRAT